MEYSVKTPELHLLYVVAAAADDGDDDGGDDEEPIGVRAGNNQPPNRKS